MHSVIEAMLAPFDRPQTPPRGLPAAAYADRQFWDAECETVFAQNWVCVGFRSRNFQPG